MFQQTVVKKYLKSVDKEKLNQAWEKFQAHFHNPQIQENIRNSKEEQYQGEFLIDLFVNVLGYTKNPTPGFNLTTELKNTQNSKKADGAILINDITKAVIELKGTNTTDLSKVQDQAFLYKAGHKGCDVVIISNFEKLRLFIRNQTEYQDFNLFSLQKDDFDLMYLLLAYEYFEKDILIKIKDESLSQEEEITKKLYKDYSAFKKELFKDLTENNPDYDALTLFKSSQKLLDRFLFLFFAEDRGLLPPNAVREILSQWEKLKELDAYDTLINRFRKYFGYLNTGFKGKKYDIFAYNGGLFAPDEILDNVKISDHILHQYTQQLADYDYQSEVDVNILGHIFENSLNEIDEIKAELAGETIEKSKTKRKKDGVFYTPKYITQYIVENTVGKLCKEKKEELRIDDEDYDSNINYQKKTLAKLEDKLVNYYDWLTQLTICDPACGSGAFLNQALDFLIKEHEYLTQLRQNLYAKNGQIAMAFPFSENDILEKNLYGVDINEESVEIAKLSLWLRTAKPNRKLNNLNQNIKVGNSLIDDSEVAGDKAFVWEKEFAHVFEKGGFDVVIGNPPYVQLQKMKDQSVLLAKMDYKTFEKTGDLYVLFYEKGVNILKEKGLLGFITSNKWMKANYGKALRSFLTNQAKPKQIIDLGSNVFESATVDSNILILSKGENKSDDFWGINLDEKFNINDFLTIKELAIPVHFEDEEMWSIESPITISIKNKVELAGKILKDWEININYGIKTGFNEAFIIDEETKNNLISKDPKSTDIIVPILRGRDIKRYHIEFANLWLINTHNGYLDNERINVNDYPAIKEHLDKYLPKLEKRYDKGDTPYNLRNNVYLDDFLKPKLYYPDIAQRLSFSYDENTFCNNTGYFINTGDKYLLSILNSNLINFYYKKISAQLGNSGIRSFTIYIENIPIPKIPLEDQQPFIEKADQMLLLNKELQEISDKFKRTLTRKFDLEKFSKKLEEWHELSYAEFIKELSKNKIKLTLAEEADWEDYFSTEKTKAENLKNQITQTDKEIDQMVYKLYDLTDEEIEIVEKG